MVGKISWVGLGDHGFFMTFYQIQGIGTQGFTCRNVDTSVTVDSLNIET